VKFPKFSYPHNIKGKFNQGKGCYWGNANVDLSADVSVGNDCLIADDVRIFTHRHTFKGEPLTTEGGNLECIPLEIGDSVGIGYGTLILPQVERIGDHSAIGAGSVLTKNVGTKEIWAGNPARKIKDREVT